MVNPAKETCPQRRRHTPCPEGYMAWHEWAEKKGRTHRAVKCPGCGLYAIWVRKARKRLRRGAA